MRKTQVMLMAMVLVLSLIFCGCSMAAKKPNAMEDPRSSADFNQKALRIAREADAVNGVKKATVVATDNKAYIGLDIMSNVEKGQTVAIEKAVVNAVKGVEPSIKTVHVSADADVVTRLKKISQSVTSGQPVSGFADELNEIGRRVTPTKM